MQDPSLVVIGAGITGLSTAIAWQLARGQGEGPALVLEKQPVCGGCVASYRREGFLIDTAQILPDPTELLAFLGVDIALRRFEGHYARLVLADPRSGATEIVPIPSGVEAFRDAMAARFPRDGARIGRFVDASQAMFDQIRHLKVEPGPLDLIRALVSCRTLLRNADRTFRQFVDSFGFVEPGLVEVLDLFAAFSGLPSERVSALMTVAAMMTTLRGAYRPLHGFVEFPVRMANRVRELGGVIRRNAPVARIRVEGDRVAGVELADGEFIAARRVVTTVDPKVAMLRLVGRDVLGRIDPAWLARVESVRMSASSFHVGLGLDAAPDLRGLGLDCGYSVVTTGRGTFGRLFDAFDRGELRLDPDAFHVAVICPSLTAGGPPSLVIRGVPAPVADWADLRASDPDAYRARKEAVADFLVEQVERYLIPDLRRHVVMRDVATPATFARYLGSPTGSNYDMAPYPDNFGRRRLPIRTPIRGLFQPKFSHGIWPSLQAGLQVVDLLTGGRILGGYSRFDPRRVRLPARG